MQVTLTATDAADELDAGMPSRPVQFRPDGNNLGSPVNLVAGQASVSTSALSVNDAAHASHTITVVYDGSDSFRSEERRVGNDQVFNKATSKETVVSDTNA